MRVVVPYTNLRDETRRALLDDHREPDYVFVGDSNIAYFELLQRLWDERRGFIIVEHDVVVYPGALAELENCPEPWCSKPYKMTTGWAGATASIGATLGCVRFSDSLVRDNPTVMDAIDLDQRWIWNRLDSCVRRILQDQVGVTHHVHWPSVIHLNPWS